MEECSRQGLSLLRLDEALQALSPRSLPPDAAGLSDAAPQAEAGSWGQDGDLSTWSGPAVAEMAFAVRAAELEVVRRGASSAAVRALLALQASDWPFMVSRGIAVPYAEERFEGHLATLRRGGRGGGEGTGLRNLAADAHGGALLAL